MIDEDEAYGLCCEIGRLEVENHKLRERADNLFNAVIAKNNELLNLLCENEKLRNQLCEFGIEVDYGIQDS